MGNHHQWIFREWVQKYSKDGSFGSRRVLCLFFWPTEKPCLLEIYRGRTGTWSPTVSTSGPHLFDLSPPNPLLLLICFTSTPYPTLIHSSSSSLSVPLPFTIFPIPPVPFPFPLLISSPTTSSSSSFSHLLLAPFSSNPPTSCSFPPPPLHLSSPIKVIVTIASTLYIPDKLYMNGQPPPYPIFLLWYPLLFVENYFSFYHAHHQTLSFPCPVLHIALLNFGLKRPLF